MLKTSKLYKVEGTSIQKVASKNTAGSFIASRVMASALSCFALINVLFDVCYIGTHIFGALIYSIRHLDSPLKYTSTTRTMAVVAVECFRHLLGACFGSFVGIISPKKASEWFLPPDQTFMETRTGNMSAEQVTKLYQMTKIVHDLFVENNIQYCMTGGTQLGAVRHGGIIPWDDDVDLFVLEKDKENISKLKEKLKKNHIGMISCHLGFKFFDLQGTDVEENHDGKSLKYKYPFIDICFAHKDSKGHITYVNDHFKRNYAGEYLLENEWEDRELQKFGPLELYGAPNPERFCKRMYGENVLQYGYQLLNHRTFSLEIPRKYLLVKNPKTGKCNPIKIPEQIF